MHYCVRAADLAESRYAHEAATALLGEALECFERIPVDRERDRDGERIELLGQLLELPDLEPAVRCRLLGAYAAELSDAQDPRVRAAAYAALELAHGLNDPGLRAMATAALGRELDPEIESPEQAELGRALDRLATEHDLPVYRWYGLFFQAVSAAVEGDVAGAHRHTAECLEVARAYRMSGALAVGECALATLAHVEGRTEDAERLHAGAADLMAQQGSPHADGSLQVALATIRAGQGRLAECLPQARDLFAVYGPLVADLLIAALAAAGQQDEARQLLAQAGPIRTDFLFKVFATFRATAMATLGERRGAEEMYAALLPYRDAQPLTSGFTLAIPPVAETLARLAALLGREEEAAVHFAQAAATAERWRGGGGV